MRIDRFFFGVGFASVVLGLLGLSAPTARADLLLAVDVSDRTATDGSTTSSGVQSGFGLYLMGSTGGTGTVTSSSGVTQVVNGYSVTLAPSNPYTLLGGGFGGMDDRDRNFSLPSGATMTYTEIYDDFIFNNQNSGGLRLTVQGSGQEGGGTLEPNTPYLVSIYTYDHATAGTHTANWVDNNHADAYVLTTTFTGGVVPFTNESNKFTGLAMTDSNGALSLIGINTSSINPTTGLPGALGVFINGFEINTAPEPSAAGLIGLASILMAGRRRKVTVRSRTGAVGRGRGRVRRTFVAQSRAND